MRSRVPLLSVLTGAVLVAVAVCVGLARPSVARDMALTVVAQPAPACSVKAVRAGTPGLSAGSWVWRRVE